MARRSGVRPYPAQDLERFAADDQELMFDFDFDKTPTVNNEKRKNIAKTK
jgi:hypothetical protein